MGNIDALRLVMLFALRYESHSGQLRQLEEALRTKGLGSSDIALIDNLLAYGGAAKRSEDLFGQGSGVLSGLSSRVKRVRGAPYGNQ